MKVTGIVAEYDPFHRGHAYHIQKARELTGADHIVVVLGGDFTQRGVPAMLDKYTRARMALSCGADLVLELPVRYACASAEYFASGAVSVLNALGCVDTLCFGSEGGDLDALRQTASSLDTAEQDPSYRQALQKALRSGYSFPAARTQALDAFSHARETISPKDGTGTPASGRICGLPQERTLRLSDRPNDILGIEYCRALARSHSRIAPSAVLRQGAGHHDASLQAGYSSASAIRRQLSGGRHPRQLSEALPKGTMSIWEDFLAHSGCMEEKDFSAMLHYRLLLLTEEQAPYIPPMGPALPLSLQDHADMTPDLADKIRKELDAFTDWKDFCLRLKSRNHTLSRLNRCLAHILLAIRQKDMEESRSLGCPVYLRMLGFSGNAAPLLTAVRRNADMPLLAGLAQARQRLSPALLPLLSEEIRASHIYQAAVSRKYGKPFQNEYRRQIVTPSGS